MFGLKGSGAMLSRKKSNFSESMRYLFTLGLMLTSLLMTSCGGDSENPEKALTGLLPGSDEIMNFTASGEDSVYDRNTVWNYIGPNADTYLYNGLQLLARRQFNAEDGADSLVVELFEFQEPRQAFALYSLLREMGFPEVAVGAQAYLRGDTLVSLKNRYLVKTFGSLSGDDPKVEEAARITVDKIKTDTPLPEELGNFPEEGLLPRSIQLTARGFMGQTELTDVFSASYLIGSDTLVFSFRLGSDNQIANVVKEYMSDAGIITGLEIEGGNQVLIGEDPSLGNLYTTLREGTLCFVTGYSDAATARKLVSDFFARLSASG